MPNPTLSEPRLIAQLRVQHGQFALQLALDLPARGITALFGRSGSGKTTALRAIAGLQRPRDAHIAIGDEVWQNDSKGIFVPVHKRALGYVFQEASLFSHLDVRANLAYGMKRVPVSQRQVSWDQAVDLLGVGPLLERRPDNLSGGERQRVAIARALLTSPRLLLMDEPLAALDAISKEAILPYLERLHAELAIPVLYVSHSIEEVARLADQIVLLDAGRVTASGPLQEVLTRLDLQTAFSDDMGTVINAKVIEHDEAYSLSRVAFDGGTLLVGGVGRAPGSAVRARVLARDVSIAVEPPRASSILNVLQATITEIRDDGADKVNVRLLLGDNNREGAVLISRITRRSRDLLALQIGQRVFAQVKSVALVT